MLRSKSIYDPVEDEDGVRILVMREWPRGIERDAADEWIPELSPSEELDMAWKSRTVEWDDYVKQYKKEVKDQTTHMKFIKELSARKDVTLLCWEKTEDFCHRKVLMEMILKTKD